MAAVTLLGTLFSTPAGVKTVFATAVNDLIVLIIAHTGDATWANPTDDNPDGLGAYTLVGSVVGNSTSALAIYVRNAAIGSASTTTFIAPDPGSDTGGGLSVLKVTGMSNYGIGAVRQSKSASIVAAPGSTGTWGSAKLTKNPIIGVLVDTSTASVSPTTGYTELSRALYNTPYCQIEVQSINSGDTSSTMDWTGTNITGQVMGIELNAPTVIDLDPATFSFTAQAPAIRRTLTTTVATFTFVANSPQLTRTNQVSIGSLDFNRQVFQITTVNNPAVAAFNFVQPSISVGNSITLSAATVGFVVNDAQLAILNNLAVGALNLTGEPTQQVVGTTLSTATMNFAGQDVAPTRTAALDPASLGFTAQTANPTSVVTLSTAVMDFVPLDVTPSNRPLGTVVDPITASFDFVVNTILVTNSIALGAAAFGFTATEISSTTVNNLTAGDLKLTPQNLTVTQAAVQILLNTAIFDFTQGSLQLTGISSAGDRKRMLFGVGR